MLCVPGDHNIYLPVFATVGVGPGSAPRSQDNGTLSSVSFYDYHYRSHFVALKR